MKVIFKIGEIKKKFPRPYLAIGVFDGLHLGHRFLIEKAIQRARDDKGTSIVMTFYPHPANVLNSHKSVALLSPLDERLGLIKSLGVDICIVIPFTKAFSRMDPKAFVENILIKKIAPREIFVGNDFKFGKNRQGNVRFLTEVGGKCGFKVNCISPVKKGKIIISSSRIRNDISDGKVENAQRLLGRPVSLWGVVRPGDSRGNSLGFPTANVEPISECLPGRGVYAAQGVIGKNTFSGMVNIGYRPTFKNDKKLTVEIHLFGFRGNLYGKKIQILFLKKIRDEKKFPSKEALITQLHQDQKSAVHFLKKS